MTTDPTEARIKDVEASMDALEEYFGGADGGTEGVRWLITELRKAREQLLCYQDREEPEKAVLSMGSDGLCRSCRQRVHYCWSRVAHRKSSQMERGAMSETTPTKPISIDAIVPCLTCPKENWMAAMQDRDAELGRLREQVRIARRHIYSCECTCVAYDEGNTVACSRCDTLKQMEAVK